MEAYYGFHSIAISKLTPIPVRGKRRRKRAGLHAKGGTHHGTTLLARRGAKYLKALNGSRVANHLDQEIIQESHSIENGINSNGKPRKAKRESKKRSVLESMPPELIEQIFLDSLEPNLPRASPYIASILSNKRIYRPLIMIALWDDPKPDDEETNEVVAKQFRPVIYTPLDLEEKKRLQLSIFNCRWCTYELLRSYLVDIAKLSVLRGDGLDTGGGIHRDPWAIVKTMENVVPAWYLDEISNDISGGLATSMFALSFIAPSVPGKPIYPVRILGIPDKLLDGRPWTPIKMEMLKFLRSFMIPVKDEIPPGEPFSRDVLHEGVSTAIMEQNHIALRALLELEEHCVRTTSFSFQDDNPAYDIPPEHFTTAIRQTTNTDIFKILVRTSAESIPYDDPEITNWAIKMGEDNPQFSKWLLELMVHIPMRRELLYSKNQSVFVCGMLVEPGENPDSRVVPYCGPSEYKRAFGKSPEPWFSEMTRENIPDGTLPF